MSKNKQKKIIPVFFAEPNDIRILSDLKKKKYSENYGIY